MKKIRSFFLIFIFMNVAVFNATIALDSEDELEYAAEKSLFNKKISDTVLAFYQKIKHLFPKKLDDLSKEDWKKLTIKIYDIYCSDKANTYFGLSSAFKSIQKAEPVDHNHNECLKKLVSSVRSITYHLEKEKKPQLKSKDINKKNIKSKHATEDSSFSKEISDKQLFFYKKIKHLFPKNRASCSKYKHADWEKLATEIFNIYCSGEEKTYFGLKSAFFTLQSAQPVNPIENLSLQELYKAVQRINYNLGNTEKKSKKIDSKPKDSNKKIINNNEKIENIHSRDNFSSKVPAKTFKCTTLSKEDEKFIVTIKSILPNDIMIEAKNVWNKSARQLLEASHLKGIRPLQNYLKELSELIKDLDLRYCIQQLKAGLTRITNLSRKEKEPHVSINEVKKNNDDSNAKRKTSASNASESSIRSKASTTDQPNEKSDVTSTSGIKAFNFTLEDIEPLFPNDLMNSPEFEWDEIASSIFDFYKLDEKNTHLELYFAFFKLKKNTTVKKNIDALQKLMVASKRLKNLSHPITKLLPFSDEFLIDLDIGKNEKSEEEIRPTTPKFYPSSEESEEEFFPTTPPRIESYYNSFETFDDDSKKDEVADNVEQGNLDNAGQSNIEIVEIFENCDQSFQNNIEISMDNIISSSSSLTIESPCHNNIVENSHTENKRNRNQYDDLEDNYSSKKQCTDEEYVKNFILDGKIFFQNEDFEQAISCFQKVLLFESDPFLEPYILEAYLLVVEANYALFFDARTPLDSQAYKKRVKYLSECCLALIDRLNSKKQKYSNFYVRTLISIGNLICFEKIDENKFRKYVKERYKIPLRACLFMDALDFIGQTGDSLLRIQAFLGLGDSKDCNRGHIVKYTQYTNSYGREAWYLSALDLCNESDYLYRVRALIGLGNMQNKNSQDIEKYSKYSSSLKNLAWYYQALDLLDKKDYPLYRIKTYMGVANYFNASNIITSIKYFQNIIDLNPFPIDRIRAHLGIGNRWSSLKDYNQAIFYYNMVEKELSLLDPETKTIDDIQKISTNRDKGLLFCEKQLKYFNNHRS
ncbi:MAG: hypothetical protein Q8S31_07900 [Alphaproteobacteria bacterium]|nr:hypothetical protein [Alphaproteobacteria bacterium]